MKIKLFDGENLIEGQSNDAGAKGNIDVTEYGIDNESEDIVGSQYVKKWMRIHRSCSTVT